MYHIFPHLIALLYVGQGAMPRSKRNVCFLQAYVMASSPQGLIGAHVGDLGDLFRATPISTSLTMGEGADKVGGSKA